MFELLQTGLYEVTGYGPFKFKIGHSPSVKIYLNGKNIDFSETVSQYTDYAHFLFENGVVVELLKIKRRNSLKIKVGNVEIGGDAPISVQSMTNTKTEDVQATLDQVKQLEDAGADLVRISVPNEEAATAFKLIKKIPMFLSLQIYTLIIRWVFWLLKTEPIA